MSDHTLSRQPPARANDPGRLAAVRGTALLDTPAEEGFDRLTRMAARILGVPTAMISLVAEDRQFIKSATGMPEPWSAGRVLAPASSICRQVVETGAPLAIEDVRRHPVFRASPAARELGWVACASVPLITADGYRVGALCAADVVPRVWTNREVELLQDLAAAAVTEIELRAARGADAFAETGVPLAVVSLEGRWTRVNRALRDLLGYEEGDLIGMPVERFTHPEDRAAEREALRLLLAGECPGYSGEKRLVHRCGEPVWVFATVTAVADRQGRPRHLAVGFQDVTERRRAEALLRESEERHRLALRAACEAVRDWDLAADRMTWGGGEPVFGWAAPAVTGPEWWYERIHPEDRERVVGAIRSAIARGSGTWEEEYRFRRADGSWAGVADRGFVLRDRAGDPVRLVGVLEDVSERQEARTALRRIELRYRSVVDHLREVVFQTDLAGRWTLLNPAWEEMTGFPVAETLGTPVLDYVHPDDRARHARELEPLLTRRKGSTRHEVRYLTRDGGFRWVEVRARLTLTEDGAPAGATGTLTDQTERKRAELLSTGQSRLLEEIASGAPLGRVLEAICRFAEEHASPCCATIMLLRPETGDLTLGGASGLPDGLGEALASVPVGPRHGSCGTAAFTRKPVVTGDIAGDPLWAAWPAARDHLLSLGIRACWSVPILSVTGEALGTFAIYHQVPREPAVEDSRIVEIATHLAAIAIEGERTRQAVGQSTRLLEQVLETLPIGVWVTSGDGRILLVNRAAQEIRGGATAGSPGGPDELAARVLGTGEPCPDELVRVGDAEGRGRILLESAIPIRGPGGEVTGAIVLSQDITERHAAEEALRRSEEQLRQAQKLEAVGRLAGGVAHDFNNLVTGILSYCELILQEVRVADPIRADVEQIRQAAVRAAALTRKLLAFSRRQVLQPRVLSLNAAVTDLEGMLRRMLGPDASLEIRLDPALGHVLADPDQLEQVLVNLVANARDAMPEGGRVTIATGNRRFGTADPDRPVGLRPGEYVTLAVSDTGVGMDEETRARAFEPFFSTKGPGKGDGLGLSTVYGIVRQSGGHVLVDSAPARGATFTLVLPRHVESGAPAADPADRRSPPGGRETLLLVEDEAAVRTSARRLLERFGYTVLEARNGADALRLVEEGNPEVDLVLTDVVMPEMGGRELVERLRARRPGLKVLYMSGYTEKAITTGGLMPPNTGFVEKPFTVDQVLRRLREILEQ